MKINVVGIKGKLYSPWEQDIKAGLVPFSSLDFSVIGAMILVKIIYRLFG